MAVNNRIIYLGLVEELKGLQNPKSEEGTETDPYENFSTEGWVKTREALNVMIAELDRVEAIKGERKTPQFYRPIFHRAVTATEEAKKLIASIQEADVKVDYEVEIPKLRKQIAELYAASEEVTK